MSITATRLVTMVSTVLLADGLYIEISRLARMSGFALEEAANVEAREVVDAVAELEDAVETVIAKDQEESWRLWEELKSVLEHGLGYWQDRRDFEQRGAEIVKDLRYQVAAVREAVESVKVDAGETPAQLEAGAADWRGTADRIEGIRTRITAMQHIPGWSGAASGGYTRRSMVQDAATAELRGMATSMSNALIQLALFNRALFLVMKRQIVDTIAAVRKLRGSDGFHFVRCINAGQQVFRLLQQLDETRIGEPIRDAAGQLQSLVDDCLASPQLLRPDSWPTGGAQAGTPPAATDTVPDPDEGMRVDDPSTQSASNPRDGIERND